MNGADSVKGKRFWTKEDLNILAEMYPNNYTKDICEKLNRSYSSVSNQAYLMGLKKSQAFMRMELEIQAKRLKENGYSSRFLKGRTPVNKGKKMPAEVYEKVKATMFKKNSVPHNAKKAGEEVLRKDKSGRKYWMIKLPGKRKLIYKHHWLWESKNGKIRKGFNVVFKDGNPLNCVLENLEYISNAALMQRNTIHRYPGELKSTIRLVNKLKRTINAKEQN